MNWQTVKYVYSLVLSCQWYSSLLYALLCCHSPCKYCSTKPTSLALEVGLIARRKENKVVQNETLCVSHLNNSCDFFFEPDKFSRDDKLIVR